MLSVKDNSQEIKPFLKVLGAGYGRTGTMSLMNALNHLGYVFYNTNLPFNITPACLLLVIIPII
jgi:hypothetical protein